MKLIVGLGNPGRKYEGTRHNVGFEVLAELIKRYGTSNRRRAYQGEVVEGSIAGAAGSSVSERVLLLAPHTFMNLSGASALAAADFYKIEPADVLVVCDDMNLPLGKVRVRASGSAGGQKGLADVIRRLGTDEVPRLRIGIDRPPEGWQGTDYVLGKFTREESTEIALAIQHAADAAALWATAGIAACMNQYN
jgi:PTH1 family peptidyl-tRNA hydrolase